MARKIRVKKLTEHLVAKLVEAHKIRTRHWPRADAGRVHDAAGLTWADVNERLWFGETGCGGQTLGDFIAEHFGVRTASRKPHIRVKQILAWADEHRKRTGEWPKNRRESIGAVPWITWGQLSHALRAGHWGFRRGTTLRRLLEKYRGIGKPKLTIGHILEWADAHHAATGRWPSLTSGAVRQVPDETWLSIDSCLKKGHRGLRGRRSLAKLLRTRRGAYQGRDRLTATKIKRWAQGHIKRTGRRPTQESGPVLDAPGEHWMAIESALTFGYRGLPGGESLTCFLDRYFEPIYRKLTVREVLALCDRYKAQHGKWPKATTERIAELGISWNGLNLLLTEGHRGLPAGLSIMRLLQKHRGVRNRSNLPRLTYAQIDRWAKAHRKRHGRWPRSGSGPIPKTNGETWARINEAMRHGRRGLRRKTSLAKRYGAKTQRSR